MTIMNNVGKTYIPDPSPWISYFRQKKRIEQKGGGKMIPIIEEYQPKVVPTDKVNVKLVSPVEAATNRNESVIKRIKKRRRRSGISSNSISGKNNTSKRSKTKRGRTKKINKRKLKDIFDLNKISKNG